MYLPTLRASSLRLARRSASTGLKYEALAVGVPKETFPLEKRCAASTVLLARFSRSLGVTTGFSVDGVGSADIAPAGLADGLAARPAKLQAARPGAAPRFALRAPL